MADDLAAWLLEQLARDEQAARALPNAIGGLQSRFSPAKLVADCEAKRRIVNDIVPAVDKMDEAIAIEWGGGAADGTADDLLQLLALPYSDRPGYRDEWRPQ